MKLRRFLAAVCLGATAVAATAAVPANRLRVPPGFTIELWTDQVPNARAMTLGRTADGRGVVYVGTMGAGKVYAVDFAQGQAGKVRTVASGLRLPAGVAWRQGTLYVSAVSRIVKLDGIDDKLDQPPTPTVVTDKLPSESHHGAKYIGFGPDGKLYVAVGAPCNVCVPSEAHGLLARMQPDGSGYEVVARGGRNSVGFDWSPVDQALWFTDNGRDMMGDDLPADELDRLPKDASGIPNYGYPWCHQGDTPDPEFGAQRRCSDFVPPVAKLGAHVAALGMRFYTGEQFPAEYRRNVFIAQHGSWNRSAKSGYQVVRVAVDGASRFVKMEPFVTGFLVPGAEGGRETVLGRPADVLVLPDGSLLVSDDLGGAIYRVRAER